MSTNTQLTKSNFDKIKGDFLRQSQLDEADFFREVSFAMQAASSNPLLTKCTQASMLKAVVNIAQSGLTLNPVKKYGYLVPRYSSKANGYEAVLEPSYMGLYKLLTDAKVVKNISCQVIYEGDEIEVDMASDRKITKHIPYVLTGKSKGKIRGVYSLATLEDGLYHCEIMGVHDLEEIKERSESYKAFKSGKLKSCTWTTDEPEMSRKAVIKRHFKYLPKSGKSDEIEKVQTAIELDHVANGNAETVNLNALHYCETLINTANLSLEEKDRYSRELESIEYQHQVNSMIGFLKKNQQIVGLESYPHSMKEIQEATANRAARDRD